MKKIIIAPDSFKGTLTAAEVCDLIADEASAAMPECRIIKLPIADGGEGTVASLLSLGGQYISCKVSGLFSAKSTVISACSLMG